MIGKRGELLGMMAILLFVLVIILGGLYISNRIKNSSKELIPLEQLKTDFNDGKICFNEGTTNDCFNIAIEKTPEERQKGLMYNKGINNDQGMLFIFDKEDFYGMWMKNMEISLDMLWVNNEGLVVFTAHDVQPCKNDYCPTIKNDIKAQYVLEIRAGMLSEKGIKVGDKTTIKILNK